MHLIAYISDYAGSGSHIQDELRQIETVSRVRNQSLGVAGVLFYFDGKFLQFIEGEEAALRQLYEMICADPRHAHIECLIDQHVEEASFSGWNMDTFNLDTIEHASTEVVKGVIDAYKANFKMKADRLVAIIKGFLLKQKPAASA